MKIKQVIRETGLTDRAIRLYIENDLVKPECDENYNGRKSIDFSESDVKQLKNIALLRKADFSIPEIKALQMGGETAQQTIKEYINKTNEKIQFNTEIIEKIGTLADEENITIEIICEKLSSNLINEKVPEEDMELSPKERKEKIVFTVISVSGIVFGIALSVFSIYWNVGIFKYPRITPFNIESLSEIPLFIFYGICKLYPYLVFFSCLGIFISYRKHSRKNLQKKIAKFIVALLCLSLFILPLIFTVNLIPSTHSETKNPSHYLEVDDDMKPNLDEIYEVFPTMVPCWAVDEYSLFDKYKDTTKYYYFYQANLFHSGNSDIYAEWQLPYKEYEMAKNKVIEKIDIVFEETKGDWKCVYSLHDEGFDNEYEYYRFLLFAYNDKTNTVRYIFSSGSNPRTPYYTTQEW